MGGQVEGNPDRMVRIDSPDGVLPGIERIGLGRERPVVVLVGGAGGMDERDLQAVAEVMRMAVAPAVVRHGAAVVDGGTDSGVMRLIGQARFASGADFPLVGVAAEGTVTLPDEDPPSAEAAALEPHHTAFLLVPGSAWGDEAPWITSVANAIAGRCASVTVLVNGGEIAYTDVAGSLAQDRPLVVLAGSGRTADAIARAADGDGGDARAVEIAASPLTRVVRMTDLGSVATALDAALTTAPA
jgi:SLOG in TRPM, prokaryote